LLSSSFPVGFGSQAIVRPHGAPLGLALLFSARGLRDISRQLYERDFAFVASGSKYQCPFFIAEFLSLQISQMPASEATIQEFFLDKKAPINPFLTIPVT
jgi:hypothetical protein